MAEEKALLNPIAPRAWMEITFYDWQWKIHGFSSRFRGFFYYYPLTWAKLKATGVHMKRPSLLGSRLVSNILSVVRILSKDSWMLWKKNKQKISKANKLGSWSKLTTLFQFSSWQQSESYGIKLSQICYSRCTAVSSDLSCFCNHQTFDLSKSWTQLHSYLWVSCVKIQWANRNVQEWLVEGGQEGSVGRRY